MSQAMWDAVKKIFKRIRKARHDTSDEERWFLAWDTLFPGVERPPTACESRYKFTSQDATYTRDV